MKTDEKEKTKFTINSNRPPTPKRERASISFFFEKIAPYIMTIPVTIISEMTIVSAKLLFTTPSILDSIFVFLANSVLSFGAFLLAFQLDTIQSNGLLLSLISYVEFLFFHDLYSVDK